MSQSILSYFKRATGAKNKDRDESVLSLSVTTTGLTEKELECVYDGISDAEERLKKKRMTNKEEDKLKIASFAHQRGPAYAVKHFIKEFPNLTESTTRGWLAKYRSQIKNATSEKTITIGAKRGRPLQLPDELDAKLRKYLVNLRDAGGNVN